MAGIGQLVQTIVALQDLRLRKEAQAMEERLRTAQLAHSGRSIDATVAQTRSQNVANFQALASRVKDQSTLLPILRQFAGDATGLDEEALRVIATGTPSSVETSRGAAVAAGNADGQFNIPAASFSLTGALPGGIKEDTVRGDIAGGASRTFGAMNPNERGAMLRGYLQRLSTGETQEQAAMGQGFLALGPRAWQQSAAVRHDLTQGARGDAQTRLGYEQLGAQNRQIDFQSALGSAQLGVQSANNWLDYQAAMAAKTPAMQQKIIELQQQRDRLMIDAQRPNSMQSKMGADQLRASINGYNAQLRMIAPEIFGPQGATPAVDIPTGEASRLSTNPFKAFTQSFIGK